MTTPRTRIYQHGLTTERRTVTEEEFDWYESNPPWYRVEPVMSPEAYPPSERAKKATPKA
jgi:hypothetical protein